MYTLMALVVTISLLFGSAGTTVYAAQASLPNEPLYPVKTWSEDTRLSLAISLQKKLDLTLGFTNRRIDEISRLQAGGELLPARTATRLEMELDSALQFAAGMDDPQMVHALSQIRLQAEIQAQTLSSLMGNGSGEEEAILRPILERLREQVRLAQAGETNPDALRRQLREKVQDLRFISTRTPTATPQAVTPQTPAATHDPAGNSYGPGPVAGQPSETPGQYGPGEPNPSRTPEPDGGSYGPGPLASPPSTTPGKYGPGPQAGTATCTPAPNGDVPQSGTNSSQTPPSNGPGPNRSTSTNQPASPEPGNGQSTATPQQNGDPGGSKPSEAPGGGNGRP
jgi:hypothetical protein